jgi:glutamate N-acetyltransferase / amino-acid N-acetyltransferase
MKLTRSPLAPERFPDLPPVRGVRAATASGGLYAGAGLERDDVFLFAFDEGTTAAGVFTQSSTASDDVERCRAALQAGGGAARALLVNAGNSNAFTGEFGRAKNTASLKALSDTLGVSDETCFLAATGVIGEPLPRADYIAEMVPDMAERLAAPDWEACARAFMTTDTFPKAAGLQLDGYALVGIAKGSGMIAPNMATMLAYVFTDAAIPADRLQLLVSEVTNETFNSISVDGDTSTSDTLMVFATGAAGPVDEANLKESLRKLCADLAEQIVRDGEGARKLIRIEIAGAPDETAARRVGATIANSPLVKTALAASDANWGRIIMAVGNAGVSLDRERLRIWFGDHLVAEGGGRAEGYSEAAASAACAGDEVHIKVDLGQGSGRATFLTCDLTHAYIDINGAYRT